MNQSNFTTGQRNASQAELDAVGKACLDHLAEEARSLQDFLQHAIVVQDAVINGESADETEFIQKQQLLDADAAKLHDGRTLVRQRISHVLGQSAELVSVKHFSQQVSPALGQQISQCRQEILELTDSIASANRTNSLLIKQTIDLQNRMQLAITGQTPKMQTYGASGQMNRMADSTMLKTEC